MTDHAGHDHGAEDPELANRNSHSRLLQNTDPVTVAEGATGMTFLIEWEPGNPGTPPHRHSGPAFGYVLTGAVRFEVEGQPEVVIPAGGTFWEPGGDVIHYQDGNALADASTSFVVTMLCAPGAPMLTLVPEVELAERAHLRAPRPDAAA